jgi:hypothetical protein
LLREHDPTTANDETLVSLLWTAIAAWPLYGHAFVLFGMVLAIQFVPYYRLRYITVSVGVTVLGTVAVHPFESLPAPLPALLAVTDVLVVVAVIALLPWSRPPIPPPTKIPIHEQ